MNINDGGSAFPYNRDISNAQEWEEVEGMTLRDYFASKAPTMEEQYYKDSPSSEHITETISSWNYLYADAMLKERSK